MSRREQFAELLHRSGGLRALLALRSSRSSDWLSILTYHRFPSESGVEHFDDGVIDATVQEFETHVSCLKRHFTIVGADELRALGSGKKLPPHPVAITFDDGYLDCYAQALPILQRHGCKAIFFVATSIITERKLYWWDRIAYLVKHCQQERLLLRYPIPLEIVLDANRSQTIERLLRLVKRQQLAKPFRLEPFLEELTAAANVPWSRELEQACADRLLMTWDQIRALHRAGMDVQSHTRSHRILQTLSSTELVEELVGSREDLERELGERPRLIAYPGGNPIALASPIRNALQKSGYTLGLNNITGPTPLGRQVDPFDIRRLAVGRNFSEPLLLSVLALPSLAHRHPWQ
ncbi:MAG TPA: polysaccharide deacetylase family protein [Polyangiaceae bacterium]|nr:polysaccharide deacetylase family protein [Polyangiaceae bacterium]